MNVQAVQIDDKDVYGAQGGSMYDDKGNVVGEKNSDDNPVVAVAEVVKGEVQPEEYRDKPFAVLFLLQVGGILTTAFVAGPAMFKVSLDEDTTTQMDDGSIPEDEGDAFQGERFLVGLVLCFIGSVGVTMAALKLMSQHAERLVQTAFFVAPATFLGLAIFTMATGEAMSSLFLVLAVMVALLSCCLYTCYKRYIPFAAANLVTALTAIRVNAGLYFLSLLFSTATFVYSIIWVIGFAGVYAQAQMKPQIDCSGLYNDDEMARQHAGEMCDQQPNGLVIFLLLICLYWSQQVFQVSFGF